LPAAGFQTACFTAAERAGSKPAAGKIARPTRRISDNDCVAIDSPNTIDIMSESPVGEVVLTVSDHLDWIDTKHHQVVLQDKLNCYLRFIESGEVFEHRPRAHHSRIVISVVGQFEPDLDGKAFIEAAKAIIERAGFGFEYRFVGT
jgi:hypothetical protein